MDVNTGRSIAQGGITLQREMLGLGINYGVATVLAKDGVVVDAFQAPRIMAAAQ